MNKKLLIGGLVSAVLLAGTLVGVSYGGGGGITEPQVIELFAKGCLLNDPTIHCHLYRLRDEDGKRTGEIVRGREPVLDVDGNVTGNLSNVFTSAKGTGSIATAIVTLKDGPHTNSGTVTLVGNSGTEQPGAVTGGTGAYVNARGYVTVDDVGGEFPFHITLHLIP